MMMGGGLHISCQLKYSNSRSSYKIYEHFNVLGLFVFYFVYVFYVFYVCFSVSKSEYFHKK